MSFSLRYRSVLVAVSLAAALLVLSAPVMSRAQEASTTDPSADSTISPQADTTVQTDTLAPEISTGTITTNSSVTADSTTTDTSSTDAAAVEPAPADVPASSTITDTQTPAGTQPNAPVAPASAPVLTTDKPDYAPGETATVFGKFFAALQEVVLYITGTNTDGSVATSYSWDVNADEAGSFATQYTLPDTFVPNYLLAANSTTGELLAETSFTDSNPQTLAVAAPTSTTVLQGNTANYGTVTMTVGGNTSSCSVTLSVSGLPSGASAVFGTNPLVTTGSNVTTSFSITTLGTTPVGTTNFSITGVRGVGCQGSGSLTSNALKLVVTSPIIKTNPTLSVTNSPVTYNGSPQAATISPSTPGTVSNVKYNGSATVPTNAGTYAVTADFTPTDTTNYNSLTGASAGNFVINKAPAGCTISGYSGTYDGAAHGATGSCTGGSDLDLGSTFTDVPGGTAHWTFTGDSNHEDASGDVAITISQAASVTTVTCLAGPFVYTGSAQTPCSATVTGAGGLSLTPTPSYSNNTNAGTATASYTYAGDTNHTGSSDSKNFSIGKADASVVITPYAVTYDGFAHTAAVTSITGVNGETGATVGTADVSNTTHTDAGLYTTDSWSFTGTANYNDIGATTITDSIAKADSTTVVTFEAGPYVYRGTAFTATANVTGAGGLNQAVTPVTYTGDCTNVTSTDGCTASVTYAGDSNHNGSSDSKSITITRADPACSVTGYTVTYDGLPHTATGSCLGVLGENLTGLDLSGTTHTGALGSPFTDTWTFTDVTGNYNNDSDTVTDTINKADQTITFANPGNQIFGSTFTPTLSASSGLPVSLAPNNLNCTVTSGTVHVVGLVGTQCSLTASQAGDSNYNAAPDVTQTFTILPYGVNTLLPPITIVKKDFQKLSTIPVKFTIFNGSTPISWAHATLTINGTPAVSSGSSNVGNNFRYDTSGQLYIFNLSTKMGIFSKGNSYTLTISLDDGETITQVITIK
jgi:hypothetical protein